MVYREITIFKKKKKKKTHPRGSWKRLKQIIIKIGKITF
jgi:hypothetical protein